MKKSVFDLTHERQLTCKADGTLYPIFCESVLPSGQYKLGTECLARMTPLINPVYSRFDLYLHYFFVPNRLIWENWEEFINPSNALTPLNTVYPAAHITPDPVNVGEPEIPVNKLQAGSLADHLGMQLDISAPMSGISARTLSLLPFRAYQQIWNDHFRDTDIEEEVLFSKTDGYVAGDMGDKDDPDFLMLRKKAWEKDYFTSARPYPQRGVAQKVFTTPQSQATASILPDPASDIGIVLTAEGVLATPYSGSQQGALINSHSSFSIEDLREANAIQMLLERSLKAGAHYFDMLKTFFGVKTMDSRFQRSEFIGGARQPVTISEVLQTSQSETSPLGTYGGHGISSGSNRIGTFTAPEHGYIIGLLSIMPRAVYVNQIRRDWFKLDRFDYFFPELANLGEQGIYNAEIRADLDESTEADTFGYQERWSEHRFIPSTVHGQFRNDAVLKNFTAGRIGSTSYVLDEDFIHVTDADQINRIFAIDDYDPFLVNVMNHVQAILPIPRHSNPSLL